MLTDKPGLEYWFQKTQIFQTRDKHSVIAPERLTSLDNYAAIRMSAEYSIRQITTLAAIGMHW